jgi:rubredoxin---NAD+ reductase
VLVEAWGWPSRRATRASLHDDGEVILKQYMCLVCGFIYDEELGWPDDGIAPGTKWADVPDTWKCPECGVGKEDFEMAEL